MKNSTAEEIVSQFFCVSRALKQKLNLRNPFYHLPLAQMETLRMIGEKRQVLMKEVADFLAITPPSATTLINNLARLGFVQRHFDKLDRRTVSLTLTKKGSEVLEKSLKTHSKNFKELLVKLNNKEQQELLKILSKMANT